MRVHRQLFLVLGLSASILVGCKVTGHDVEAWKGTVKGPDKLVALLLSDRYPIELRTQAAIALVAMERQDEDGIARLEAALVELPEETRRELVGRMVPALKSMMWTETKKADEPALDATRSEQIRAKDAAYLMIAHAAEPTRSQLVEEVVRWYVVDFNGRSLAGNYSAEQVVRALGPKAAAQLVSAMNGEMPQAALVKIAELVAQIGDAETRSRAAKRLLAIEADMSSPKFLGWLKGRIREELAKQASDTKPDEGRIQVIAELNRENFINEGALPAMKHLASEKVIADRLLAIASTDDTSEAMVERRRRALQALEGKVSEEHLESLLALALTGSQPVPVRDYAFDRIAETRSAKAIPSMWPLFESPADPRLRWRAGEIVLAIGGPEVAPQFFQRLPARPGMEYSREELEGYATRLSQMKPAPTEIVRTQLQSPDWWDRIIALRYFERRGTEADVPALEKLLPDGAKVSGEHWDEGTTVGKVAEEAIAALRERLSEPQNDGAAEPG